MTDHNRKKTVGWIAGAALAATVMGVTGCSSDSDSGDSGSSEKKPAAQDSSAAPDSGGEKGSGGKGDDGGKGGGGAEAGQPATARQSSVQGAVSTWVAAIIKGQPKKACLVMAEPAAGSKPAKVGSPARCNSNAPEAKKQREGVSRFREAFSPKPPSANPKVEVAQVPDTGGKAVVPADKITVDGKSLKKIIVANSTGVKESQMDVKTKAGKIDGAWYVTDLDLNIG